MPPGISGSLIPSGFLHDVLPARFAADLAEAGQTLPRGNAGRWWRRVAGQLGPVSSARAVLDVAVLPLLDLLDYEVLRLEPYGDGFAGSVGRKQATLAVLLVLPWSGRPANVRHDLQRAGRQTGVRWGLVCTGRRLQIFDATRTWSRRTLEFDLTLVMADESSLLTLWMLLRAGALAARLLDRIVAAADEHALGVCASLGDGVLKALGGLVTALDRPARPPSLARTHRRASASQAPALTDQRASGSLATAAFEQSLTLVYRVLFLLFAEARALVPIWHRVYREAYTIDALCTRSIARARAPGLWDALQAISRLAHAGCRAGDLTVTPFNGRLFSPAHTPLGERARVPDRAVRDLVLALATGETPDGRRRIAYRDLGVEELGAVYERVLEYEPVRQHGPLVLARSSLERKSTGSFYTPRSITEFLVRRTLDPLVRGRSADEILSLRVLDPAMGSGAFLVAACRFLARAAAHARVESGEWQAEEVTRERTLELRRAVAQRCLYGVDFNPMAVQLARLSLWLTTLAAEKPVTFLDHHLASGDSLVGARLEDIARQPPGTAVRGRVQEALPLFDADTATAMATLVLPDRFRLADEPGDTPSAVREKERALVGLTAAGAPLQRWKSAADLWCAGWFDRGLTPAIYADLLATILDRGAALPERQSNVLLDDAAATARRLRAFHWQLEFPEVFFGRDGRPRPDAGFDAVLGNPPWDVLRQPDRLRFFRASSIYPLQAGGGHPNRYQLFVERALQLVRRGGRLGVIVPSGLATDRGSATLRRALFDSVQIDRLLGFTNRDGIFPIHRDVRFLLLTGTTGAPTDRLRCRFGLRAVSALDTLPDAADDDPPDAHPIMLSRAVLDRWDPEHLAIPELHHPRDLDILTQITTAIPRLADATGWHARFGRELNATDDRAHFVDRPAPVARDLLPVMEGKHLEPFRALADRSGAAIPAAAAARLLDPAATFDRIRLAYRDVASATNRLTLIAALLPARTVSTHTLFCLKTPLGVQSQYCLLALLNSLVANYLVRLQVTTHVTAGLMAKLPVPKPSGHSPEFHQLASLAKDLEQTGIEANLTAYARLNTIAARLYGLTSEQFDHVLTTFPLLPAQWRERCAAAFRYPRATETRRHREER